MVRSYWGTILSVDDSVGKLVDQLKSSGELDNTIIVFMGDNGLLEGEHGMVDKRTMHEASIRIPLIVRYPGLASAVGKRVREQVLTIDMAPTICELAGSTPLENIHGRSFVKLVREGDPDWRKAWLYHYNYEKQFPYTPNVRGIRTERWKYIHYPHGDGSPDRHLSELYDLQADPDEKNNLAAQEEQKGTIAQLQGELQRLMKQNGIEEDKMPLDEGIQSQLPEQSIR
jgi:N-acetylglucosamine-6-sulfatase